MNGRVKAMAGAGAAALALGVGMAGAAEVPNGNFERGNLSGWDKDRFGPGNWRVYKGKLMMGPAVRGGGLEVALRKPPQGKFGAAASQNEVSSMFLSRKVKLAPGKRHKLQFKLSYHNTNTGKKARGGKAGFITPNTFEVDEPNQQFRMDVVRPNAAISSLSDQNVLKSVYRTKVGDPDRQLKFRKVTANLTKFAGQTVRLRFGVAVTQARLLVGIDAVKVKTRD